MTIIKEIILTYELVLSLIIQLKNLQWLIELKIPAAIIKKSSSFL
jgi:hypothetical protein